jgi:hypothetical protein
MAYYNKTYGQGWFNESQRHALAAQGVKTGRFEGLKKFGSAAGKGAKWLGESLKEGVGLGSDDDSKQEYQKVVEGEDLSFPESEVSYSWDAGSEASPEVTSYALDVGEGEGVGGVADNILGEDHSRHTHDVEVASHKASDGLSGDLLDGDETPAQKIHSEVDELVNAEDPLVATPPRERFMENVMRKFEKVKEWYFSDESDHLHDEIISLDSDKILLRDKIGMMNGLKQKVLKSKDVSFGEKVELVERIDNQVAPLIRDLNKLDLKVSESKALLSKLGREQAGISSSRRLSTRSEPLIPSPVQLIKEALSLTAKGKKREYGEERGKLKWKSVPEAPHAEIEKKFKKGYGRSPTSQEMSDILLGGEF